MGFKKKQVDSIGTMPSNEKLKKIKMEQHCG